jgi:hypothetical protein
VPQNIAAIIALLAGVAQPSANAQTLSWAPCDGIANPAVQCATVGVPLDYARPYGRRIEIVISRLAPADPARRRGVAFPGSRLVTIDAQTHAPFPYFGNTCLNAATVSYLATGVLPPADVAC